MAHIHHGTLHLDIHHPPTTSLGSHLHIHASIDHIEIALGFTTLHHRFGTRDGSASNNGRVLHDVRVGNFGIVVDAASGFENGVLEE